MTTPLDPPVKVSDQALKVINELRKKPELLTEVADQFAIGWPTDKLLLPWEVTTRFKRPTLVRFLYGAPKDSAAPIAGVGQFIASGHEGDQWEAAIVSDPGNEDTRPTFRRRIFSSATDATEWADMLLTDLEYTLSGPEALGDALLKELKEMEDKIAEAKAKAEEPAF